MDPLLQDLGLLVPLVDLVKEGFQNSLDCLVRLGLNVGNQLVVTLPLVLMENLLDSHQSGNDVSKPEHVRKQSVGDQLHVNAHRHLPTLWASFQCS